IRIGYLLISWYYQPYYIRFLYGNRCFFISPLILTPYRISVTLITKEPYFCLRYGKKSALSYGIFLDFEGTRALAFVAMLAYMIIYHIWGKCTHLDIPLEEIISRIEDIQTIEIKVAERWIPKLPSVLRNDQQILLDALEIRMPKAIKHCSTC
ncbi:MAG: hypothetical protein ABH952_02950, partial [Candidatus Omnitrophota bacterium]